MITDVSSKSQAASLHINYSAAIAGDEGGAPPVLHHREGSSRADHGVGDPSPGESDYNPLWEEVSRDLSSQA